MLSRKQKKTLVRILISGALFAGAFFIPVEGIWKLGVYLIPYFVIGWDVLWKAVRNISHGQVFDENFLMALATVVAVDGFRLALRREPAQVVSILRAWRLCCFTR